MVVHGQSPGASCGLGFERGEAYLVFAGGAGRDAGGPLETGLCRTARLVSEETARNMLGPPTNSLPETGDGSPECAERKLESTCRGATTAALALLAAGALFAGRAMRGPEVSPHGSASPVARRGQ